MPKRKTDDEFKNELKEKYDDRIGYKGVYTTAHTPLNFYCKICGYEFQQTPNGMLRKGVVNGCNKCGHKRCRAMSNEEFVKRMREEYGETLIILTNYETYNTLIDCKCAKCGRINTKSARGWLNDKGGCVYCKGTRLHIDDYKTKVKQANPYIDVVEYNGTNYTNKFYCNKHDLHFSTNWTNRLGHICPKCSLESRSGSNHYEWKGGITPIVEHCRSVIRPLKVEMFVKSNHKCSITGKIGMLEVHHIIPFRDIVINAHKDNNICIKEQVGDYTIEELEIIENYMIEFHKKDGVWVVISKELHNEFHTKYGYKESTKEDWFEFISGI